MIYDTIESISLDEVVMLSFADPFKIFLFTFQLHSFMNLYLSSYYCEISINHSKSIVMGNQIVIELTNMKRIIAFENEKDD